MAEETYKGLRIALGVPNPADRRSCLFGLQFAQVLRPDGGRLDSDYYKKGQEASVAGKMRARIDSWEAQYPRLFR